MTGTDWRNVRNGDRIPVKNYSDQPYVVKTDDGAWLMVVTTGVGDEGHPGQHITSARSTDCGKTRSAPLPVESPDNPESSYAVLYKTDFGRVYCFYNYNAENRRFVLADPGTQNNGICHRVDSQGEFVFKYSDDNGLSWSEKWYSIPQRKFRCDLENPYKGEVLYFWNVGKPFEKEKSVFVPLYKIGGLNEQFMYNTECALLKCSNINTEKNPEKLVWETYPDGDTGIRVPREISNVSEEHSFVVLSDGSIFCVFRTIAGNSYCSYSRDGGHTFTEPETMKYSDGREIKHSRAANFIWKCENGKYLYWYHNHGGKSYDDRNPVWISGAVEYEAEDGIRLKFSQPEILLYDEDVLIRMSYPDLIEDGGEYYFTETQKCIARTHKADKKLIEGLWAQLENTVKAPNSAVLKDGSEMPVFNSFIETDTTRADRGAKDVGGGFAIVFEATLPIDGSGKLFSAMTADKKGISAEWNSEEIVFTMGDGRRVMQFFSDKKPLANNGTHKIGISVDAGPRVVSMIIDNMLCDGGDERQFGYGWFDRNMLNANGEKHIKVYNGVSNLKIFNTYITNSEIMAI
ncbi:MAG: exo-alpha-sialidase [Clostridia bacterium]|nr:exo-alpha-sialidase [Clostridia bacterium]